MRQQWTDSLACSMSLHNITERGIRRWWVSHRCWAPITRIIQLKPVVAANFAAVATALSRRGRRKHAIINTASPLPRLLNTVHTYLYKRYFLSILRPTAYPTIFINARKHELWTDNKSAHLNWSSFYAWSLYLKSMNKITAYSDDFHKLLNPTLRGL